MEKLGLAVEDMSRHMTNEGWQIFQGLEQAGWVLYGYNLPNPSTDVAQILSEFNPTITVLQDKREWDRTEAREPRAHFDNISALASHPTKVLTILKDSHQRPDYHHSFSQEIGCDAWIVYYNPDVVHALAPYTRRSDLIRTYHTVNPERIPGFSGVRSGTLLSGAASSAYPLRQKMIRWYQSRQIRCHYLPHPGYHNKGCQTYDFYKVLSKFKVSICTGSKYRYTLRKVFESLACGCRVITDYYEPLPHIEKDWIIYLPENPNPVQVQDAINCAEATYDPDLAYHIANIVQVNYNYVTECARLDASIKSHFGLC